MCPTRSGGAGGGGGVTSPVGVVDGGTGETTAPEAAAALLGIRTHSAGTFAFFVNTDTGDDANDGLTVGTPWKTGPRCREAHRYSRIVLGEEKTLVFNLRGSTLPFEIKNTDWHEASNVNFLGSDETEVLASTATTSASYSTAYDGFLKLAVSGTPFSGAGDLADGTFVIDVAGTQKARAVLEAFSTNELWYTGHNSNSIVQVITSPSPIRLYKQATTVNITGFGSNDRPLWDNVRFEKLDIGPDAETLRPTNGSVHFVECSVRLNYSQEADLAVFERCWFKPQSFINLGRMSFLGGVIDGRGSTLNLTRSRKDTQVKNAIGIYKPDSISHEGNTSLTRGGTVVHWHCVEMVKIAPSVARIGPGGVIPFDHIILTGEMRSGAGDTIIDGGNVLLGGHNALTDIRQFGGVDAALVTGMLRDTIVQAGAPGVADDDANGFSVGNRIIDTAANTVYECVDSSTGAAVWKDLTAAPPAPPYVISVCPFGAKSDGTGKFLIANGKTSDGDDSSKDKTRQAVPVPAGITSARLIALVHYSKEADLTTVMKVHINGLVVDTITLAPNANGAGQEAMSETVADGDYAEIEYDANQKPGECAMSFLLEVTP